MNTGEVEGQRTVTKLWRKAITGMNSEEQRLLTVVQWPVGSQSATGTASCLSARTQRRRNWIYAHTHTQAHIPHTHTHTHNAHTYTHIHTRTHARRTNTKYTTYAFSLAHTTHTGMCEHTHQRTQWREHSLTFSLFLASSSVFEHCFFLKKHP
jgi:hypothetical protein